MFQNGVICFFPISQNPLASFKINSVGYNELMLFIALQNSLSLIGKYASFPK